MPLKWVRRTICEAPTGGVFDCVACRQSVEFDHGFGKVKNIPGWYTLVTLGNDFNSDEHFALQGICVKAGMAIRYPQLYCPVKTYVKPTPPRPGSMDRPPLRTLSERYEPFHLVLEQRVYPTCFRTDRSLLLRVSASQKALIVCGFLKRCHIAREKAKPFLVIRSQRPYEHILCWRSRQASEGHSTR